MTTKHLFITLLIIPFFVFAQNKDLARAYYNKAEEALEAKKYYDVEQYLNKTKEYAGKTNAEIIYLEIKLKYATDINLKETKKLCKQFLEKAFEDDERRDEISSLYVDIETSKEIDQFGNFYYKDGRNGKYYEYFPNGQLKNESIYNGYHPKEIKRYFNDGKKFIDKTYNGTFKQYYPSGNIQFTGQVDVYGVISGVSKYYRDGEFEEENQDHNLLKLANGEQTNPNNDKINLLVPSDYFDANGRKMKDWKPFLNKIENDSINLYEAYAGTKYSDFDIILWNACSSSMENNLFFEQVDDLLQKGKYIIICGSNACVGRNENGKKTYASEFANIIANRYNLYIASDDPFENYETRVTDDIFPKDFSFLSFRNPFVKKTNYRDSNTKIVAEDFNSNGIIGLYIHPNSKGKLFITGISAYSFGLGSHNKNTKQIDLRIVDTLFHIIKDFKKNK